MKPIFLNPTFKQNKDEISNQTYKLDNIIEFSKIISNVFNETPKSIINSNFSEKIIELPASKNIIQKKPTIPLDFSNLVNLTKNTNINEQESYNENLPNAEIISLVDFYPLLDNNNQQTNAGKHFKYQLLYLNANRIILNKEFNKYFSQNQKDLTYSNQLNDLLLLLDDKKNLEYYKSGDLYDQKYFNKLLMLTDYSLKETEKFYFRISQFGNLFSDKKNALNLLKKLNFQLNSNIHIQKIYALLFISLEEKLFLKSKKLFKDQRTTQEKSIYFDILKEDSLKNYPDEYKNIKVNDTQFNKKIPYFKSGNNRKDFIFEDLVYESYKDENKDLTTLNINNTKVGITKIDSISLNQSQFNSGTLLTLLSSFPVIDGDNNRRFLFESKEKDQYTYNVFEKIISSNFDSKYIDLLFIKNENRKNEQVSNVKSSLLSNINKSQFNISSLKRNLSIIDNAINNETPQLHYLIRQVAKFINKIDINKFKNNFDSIIDELNILISFYYEIVKFSKEPNINLNDLLTNLSSRSKTYLNKNENFKLIHNETYEFKNIFNKYSQALALIHFNFLTQEKVWKEGINISPQYIPYSNLYKSALINEWFKNNDVDISDEQKGELTLDFIGFLTYLFKRTSQNPGQVDLSYDDGKIVGDIINLTQDKISELKSNYNLDYQKHPNFNISIISNDSGDLSQSYWMCFMELLKTIRYTEYEYSSYKNLFYRKFLECFLNISKKFGISDDIIKNENYNYNDTLSINNENLYLLFNIFILIVDIIKSLFHYNARVLYSEITDYENTDGINSNEYIENIRILSSDDCIGLAGLCHNIQKGELIVYPNPYFDKFPEYGALNSEYYKETGQFVGSWAVSHLSTTHSSDSYLNITKPLWAIGISGDEEFEIENVKQSQKFRALEVNFVIDNQIKEFKTFAEELKLKFQNFNEIYNFIKNKISIINNELNELRNIDYDFLSSQINPNFKLNKRSFFMSRYQIEDIKKKYNKIIKYKNNNDFIIEDIIDDKYENVITTSINQYKDNSKNAKILTFGYPIDAQDSKEINIEIHRKNLIYQDLIFKPIIKSFNLNLFCNITELFDTNINNINDLIKNAKYYEYQNFDFTLKDNSSINQEILNNHYYNEILNHYLKIMTGLDINDYTLIQGYPVIDSEEVLSNISDIIYNNDEQKNEKKQALLTLQNKLTTFISPLEFRSLIYSNSLFERIFSTLIDPDDFEVDTSNWIKNGWMSEKNSSNNTNTGVLQDLKNIFGSDILNTEILQDFELENRIRYDKLPFKINIISGKIYLNDDDNITDSYKIKIDKKV